MAWVHLSNCMGSASHQTDMLISLNGACFRSKKSRLTWCDAPPGFFTANFEPDSYDCLRDKFLGSYRTESNPLAVERGECSGSAELGGNHCGALHKRLTLAPGEEARRDLPHHRQQPGWHRKRRKIRDVEQEIGRR